MVGLVCVLACALCFSAFVPACSGQAGDSVLTDQASDELTFTSASYGLGHGGDSSLLGPKSERRLIERDVRAVGAFDLRRALDAIATSAAADDGVRIFREIYDSYASKKAT